MVKKLVRIALPILLSGGALLAGAAGGEMLRGPAPGGGTATDATSGEGEAAPPGAHPAAPEEAQATAGHDSRAPGEDGDLAYLKFPQQFFVPLVRGGELRAVMILALSLEMPAEVEEAVSRQEHRLRDALLRRLLIHANSGGFDGNFTAEAHLALLRDTLLAEARKVADPAISGVLIGDIARQEQ